MVAITRAAGGKAKAKAAAAAAAAVAVVGMLVGVVRLCLFVVCVGVM